MEVTTELARRIRAIRYENLPTRVLPRAKIQPLVAALQHLQNVRSARAFAAESLTR